MESVVRHRGKAIDLVSDVAWEACPYMLQQKSTWHDLLEHGIDTYKHSRRRLWVLDRVDVLPDRARRRHVHWPSCLVRADEWRHRS